MHFTAIESFNIIIKIAAPKFSTLAHLSLDYTNGIFIMLQLVKLSILNLAILMLPAKIAKISCRNL